MTQTNGEKRIQALTMLAPLASELRELQDQNLIDAQNMSKSIADVLDRSKTIGAKIGLAETRLKGVMSLSDWLSNNVANIQPHQAQVYRKIAKGELSDPRQQLMSLCDAPKQIENSKGDTTVTPASQWELAWKWITKLQRVELADWPQQQLDLTKDNIAAIVTKFGGQVKWD